MIADSNKKIKLPAVIGFKPEKGLNNILAFMIGHTKNRHDANY